MNKKPKKISVIVFLLLVITVIIGVNTQLSNNKFTKLDECTLQNNICFFSHTELDLRLEFNQKPIVEEELFMTLSGGNNVSIKTAWIEGVNMYMGKTPVMLSPSEEVGDVSDKTIIQGLTFLGSCSQPVMQWRLFIEVENDQTQQSKVYSALFSTSPE